MRYRSKFHTKDLIREILSKSKDFNEKNGILEIIWRNGSTSTLPSLVTLTPNMAWLIGVREGDRGDRSNGEISLANTELSLIKRFRKVLIEELKIPSDRIRMRIFSSPSLDKSLIRKEIARNFPVNPKNIKFIDLKSVKKPVFHCFILNKPLRRVLDRLKDLILDSSNTHLLSSYIAGFFDADGHVDKINNCFSWRFGTRKNAVSFMKILRKLGFQAKLYSDRNGSKKFFRVNIGARQDVRENDFQLFRRNILGYMHHVRKKKEAEELLKGMKIREKDKKYLLLIKEKFGEKEFTVYEFRKLAKCSLNHAWRLLKNFKESKLLEFREGKRIRINGKLYGQTRGKYKINERVFSFSF